MFERFTDRARRVIVLAQEEARTLQGECHAERPHSLHPACQAGVGAVAT